jgi:hypothetical protein
MDCSGNNDALGSGDFRHGYGNHRIIKRKRQQSVTGNELKQRFEIRELRHRKER